MAGEPAGTGRGVRIAVIDSGVHADHPHVGGVAGGVRIVDGGVEIEDYVDILGHGTAVSAAIKEKAPAAELYAVQVFHFVLSTSVSNLVAAIDWAVRHEMHVVNLSLGTARPEHEAPLRTAVARATARDVVIVAAAEDEGVRWLPGSLPGVIGVQVDAACPRDEYRLAAPKGSSVFRASGLPREIPGVPVERNLSGVSFAVANMTGFVARVRERATTGSFAEIVQALEPIVRSR